MKPVLLLAMLLLGSFFLHAQETASSDTTTKADSADLYGLIPQRPIKVGGGPANQRAYLESLRDAQDKPVSYERKGSCCPFETNSPMAFMGGGLLDRYEITYRDAGNKKMKLILYLSFYDYEEPRAVKGFTIR